MAEKIIRTLTCDKPNCRTPDQEVRRVKITIDSEHAEALYQVDLCSPHILKCLNPILDWATEYPPTFNGRAATEEARLRELFIDE